MFACLPSCVVNRYALACYEDLALHKRVPAAMHGAVTGGKSIRMHRLDLLSGNVTQLL